MTLKTNNRLIKTRNLNINNKGMSKITNFMCKGEEL